MVDVSYDVLSCFPSRFSYDGSALRCFLVAHTCRRTEIIHDPTTGSGTVRGHHRPHSAGHRPHAFHPRPIFDQALSCHALSWLHVDVPVGLFAFAPYSFIIVRLF